MDKGKVVEVTEWLTLKLPSKEIARFQQLLSNVHPGFKSITIPPLTSLLLKKGPKHLEFLALKLALEECCHWLERAAYPFTSFTNHKNLCPLAKPGGLCFLPSLILHSQTGLTPRTPRMTLSCLHCTENKDQRPEPTLPFSSL